LLSLVELSRWAELISFHISSGGSTFLFLSFSNSTRRSGISPTPTRAVLLLSLAFSTRLFSEKSLLRQVTYKHSKWVFSSGISGLASFLSLLVYILSGLVSGASSSVNSSGISLEEFV